MRQFVQANFTLFAMLMFSVAFIVIILRAWHIPITHDEASTFFFYVQPGEWRPYIAHAYTNNHVLNSALASLSYRLFGSHPFVLRLPNVLSFILLAWGVYRLCVNHLRSLAGRFCLFSLTVLTFNLLDFFQLSRGYGLSLAGMVLGISFLHDFFESGDLKWLVFFSVCWQLALIANLTLVPVISLVLLLTWINQLAHRRFFKPANLLLQVLNVWLVVKSVRLALWYRQSGLLDSGRNFDYWNTTFRSLMELVFGTGDGWIQAVLVILVLIAVAAAARQLVKKHAVLDWYHPRIFALLMLCLLTAGYFFQRVLMDVNFPDDRTALALYVFAALAISFCLDGLPRQLGEPFAVIILLYSMAHFFLAFNLRTFTHYFYHVMPRAFYEYLRSEQLHFQHPLTIGGHVNRQMNYEFANYRNGGALNHMEVQDHMRMNCDYYYARKADVSFYSPFYEEVMSDDWDRVLLKRKTPVRRIPARDLVAETGTFSGSDGFFELLRAPLPVRLAGQSIGIRADLSFDSVPVPFRAHFVLEIQGRNKEIRQYRRFEVNHTADDLNGSRRSWQITSDPLPADSANVVLYIWNIKGARVRFRLDQLEVSLLRGDGINTSVSPAYDKFLDWKTLQL